ncbi:MAG: lysyl oxidase family protein [Gemmatimonadales bacterium]
MCRNARSPIVVVAAGLALAACSRPDGAGTVAAPQFAHVQDLIGTPDLIVDAKKLATSWVVYDQELKESFCSIDEADLAPGRYRVLRFTVNTPNIGDADVFIGSPWKHMDPNDDGSFADSDGLYEESTCHRHFHFRNYALYQLIDAATGKVFRARKNGFCMIDITPWSEEVPPGSWVYRSCGNSLVRGSGFQGISVGYGDEYFKWLGGQYFVLEGDPNAEPIPPGQYLLRIWVNPPFVARGKEVCPAKDPQGLCHMFVESDYGNNIGQALITIPAGRPGKTGFGPGGGQLAQDEAIDDENRPNK